MPIPLQILLIETKAKIKFNSFRADNLIYSNAFQYTAVNTLWSNWLVALIIISLSLPLHCVKSVQIRSYLCFIFSCIRTEYGDLLCKSPYSVQIQENKDQKKLRSKSPYSVRIQENTDQKKLRIWTFSHSEA